MKKILITGGLGFISSHFVKRMLGKGYSFTLVDNKPSAHFSELVQNFFGNPEVTVIQEDLTRELLDKLNHDYDYIIHAAALLGVEFVMQNPYQSLKVNSETTLSIVDFALKQKKLERFLYISTSEIYGINAVNVNEETPTSIPNEGIRWNYATGKIFGEYLTKSAYVQYNLPIAIVRPFNVYGPYRYGSNALSTFIKNALQNKDLIVTGNGKQMRSWCYIDDFIDGLICVLGDEKSIGQAFNIGNDHAYLSIHDLAKLIVESVNSGSKVIINHQDTEDVMDRRPSIKKAKTLLGYKPNINLKDGLKETVEWYAKELFNHHLTS
ncbi:MAG: hypothetical protein C0425_10055 [Chlorobiaceae bacterium]|nr:hypothetical protein [Chlorobiaceae bacterium]